MFPSVKVARKTPEPATPTEATAPAKEARDHTPSPPSSRPSTERNAEAKRSSPPTNRSAATQLAELMVFSLSAKNSRISAIESVNSGWSNHTTKPSTVMPTAKTMPAMPPMRIEEPP